MDLSPGGATLPRCRAPRSPRSTRPLGRGRCIPAPLESERPRRVDELRGHGRHGKSPRPARAARVLASPPAAPARDRSRTTGPMPTPGTTPAQQGAKHLADEEGPRGGRRSREGSMGCARRDRRGPPGGTARGREGRRWGQEGPTFRALRRGRPRLRLGWNDNVGSPPRGEVDEAQIEARRSPGATARPGARAERGSMGRIRTPEGCTPRATAETATPSRQEPPLKAPPVKALGGPPRRDRGGRYPPRTAPSPPPRHSTVTLLARFRGLSISQPWISAMWYEISCRGMVLRIGDSHSEVRGTGT